MSVEATVTCDQCSSRADKAFCSRCFSGEMEDVRDKAAEDALIGYVPEDEARAESVSRVRDWAEREKALGRLTPEQFALVERCAEDLEVG